MPIYTIEKTILDIARNALLIDSNILVAAFREDGESGQHDLAKFLLEEGEYPLLIPTVVIVEAWGLIASKRRDFRYGLEFLSWLSQPSRTTIVPSYQTDIRNAHELVKGLQIDSVDAIIAEMATDITEKCSLKPYLPIATFDTADFTRIMARKGIKLSIHDLRNGIVELD